MFPRSLFYHLLFLISSRPGARFTKYLTIYRKVIAKFVVRSTYDSDFKRAKISIRNIVSLFANTVSNDVTTLQLNRTYKKSLAPFVGCLL